MGNVIPYQRKFRLSLCVFGVTTNVIQSFIPFLDQHSRIHVLRLIVFLLGSIFTVGFLFSCIVYFYYTSKREESITFIQKYCLLQSLLLTANILSKVLYGITISQDTHKFYSQQSTIVYLFIETVTGVLAYMSPTRMVIEEVSVAKVFFHFCLIKLFIVNV